MNVENNSKSMCVLTPVNFVICGELTIDAPVEAVWPRALEYTSWQHFTHVESISGKASEEGEVVLLRKVEKGLEEFPPYYAKTLKLVNKKQIVWKTFPKEGEDFSDFTGIIDFRFRPVNGNTNFSYSIYYEFRIQENDDKKVQEYERDMKANFEALIADTMPRLKHLVESEG